MYEALRFVRGAVAKKDFVPALRHFVLKDRTVRAFNGTLTMCSPIDMDITCAPLADMFTRAIANCTDVVSIHHNQTSDTLQVTSGNFNAFVPCIPMEDMPQLLPKGTPVAIDGQRLVAALEAVSPFIGDDASRPWSNGVLLHGGSAYATNNICLVQYWLGADFPLTLNIPEEAVQQVLSVGTPPEGLLMDDNSVTFLFPGDRWIRTQVLTTEWPNVVKILDNNYGPCPEVPETLAVALEQIKPFVTSTGRLYVQDQKISTTVSDEAGVVIEVPGLAGQESIFTASMLRLVCETSRNIDFTKYPAPVPFNAGSLRGIILGIVER